MAIDEGRRLELAQAAAATLGDNAGATLMELVVPAGELPATRRDLEGHADRTGERMTAFETRMGERMTAFETRMGERMTAFETRMDERMTMFETRMDERMTMFETRIDERITAFEHRIERKIDQGIETLRADLTAVFRAELVTAVSSQTRALIIATATAVFGIGGLAVTLAQVLP